MCILHFFEYHFLLVEINEEVLDDVIDRHSAVNVY